MITRPDHGAAGAYVLAVVLAAVAVYFGVRTLWTWLGLRQVERRWQARRTTIESGMDYARRLPCGPARDAAWDAIGRSIQELKTWPEPWECLAWSTTGEIEAELRRRRGA